MDPQVSGSFIPKQPLVATRAPARMGLVLLLCILLFIASVLGAAAVFAYEGILNSTITKQDAQLSRAEGAFEPKVIEDLARLDQRLTQTRGLLERHLAPSAIFDFLSGATLEKVQFTKMSYKLASAGATIALTGTADSFSTVALQSDQFGSSRLLKNVVFSNVTVGSSGKVSFNVEAQLDPSLYLFARQDNTAAAIPTGAQASTTTQ